MEGLHQNPENLETLMPGKFARSDPKVAKSSNLQTVLLLVLRAAIPQNEQTLQYLSHLHYTLKDRAAVRNGGELCTSMLARQCAELLSQIHNCLVY